MYNPEFDQLLTTAYRRIMKVEELMLRDLSSSALTISEMHMLESIGKQPQGGVNITDIAQDQEITLPSVTTAVQKLERKGYVIKEKSSVDARRVTVKLTEAGRRAEIAHRYFHRQMVKDISSQMTPGEREALLSGLRKLNAFLESRTNSERG